MAQRPEKGGIAQEGQPPSSDIKRGLSFKRYFTQEGVHPFDMVEWEKRESRLVHESGKVLFHQEEVEVPKGWSQLATDIMASKYFRQRGVPRREED